MNCTKYVIPAIVCSVVISHAAESSSNSGYEDGFRVGQARHNNKEEGLDASRLARMAGINSDSHVEGGTGRTGAKYQAAFLKGYADGFAGKARGGGAQDPLPDLPVKIARQPLYAHKDLSNSKTITLLSQLAAMTTESPDKDVFIVTAHQRLNENITDHIRMLYDRKEKLFLKLSRLEINAADDSYSWVLILNVAEDALSEAELWSGEPPLRSIRSKYNKAKDTVPLQYEKNPKFSVWP